MGWDGVGSTSVEWQTYILKDEIESFDSVWSKFWVFRDYAILISSYNLHVAGDVSHQDLILK